MSITGTAPEIIKPGSEGFTEDEFQQAKSYFDGRWKRMGERPSMVFSGYYPPMFFGNYVYFSYIFNDAFIKTTLKQANEAVEEYLKREKLYTFTYRANKPENPEERINA